MNGAKVGKMGKSGRKTEKMGEVWYKLGRNLEMARKWKENVRSLA